MVKKIQSIIILMIIFLSGYGLYQYYDTRSILLMKEIPIQTEQESEEQIVDGNPIVLPSVYDSRETSRSPVIKNQGDLGTCWAVASSSALEASLLTREHLIFAADHISLRNHFTKNQNDGGDYTMAMAYLAGWQGPILEKDDPYGDSISPEGAKPVKHVQEIQMIKNKDYHEIKRAVYEYGAVQSSLYMDLQNTVSSSVFYNTINSSYCYVGQERSNHDIMIIGWDDNYPAENFNAEITKDGAFICQNSWGTEFGEDGIFFVSYEDANLGNNCIAYTRVEDTGNYTNIYQTDLCGWVGQIGYGGDTCYFANVYETKGKENLCAVGFYAVGKDTEYELYVIEEFEGTSSFIGSQPVQKGKFRNIGYYTVDLEKPVTLQPKQRYAVMVKITTPEIKFPVATQYQADEATKDVDISKGEGYISATGAVWTRVEEEHSCNVCLKAYTRE